MVDPKRPTFDPTINLGHVLTFFGFIGTGLIGYSALDKRVVVVEERAAAIERRVDDQDSRIKESLGEIKADLKDVKRGIEDMKGRR